MKNLLKEIHLKGFRIYHMPFIWEGFAYRRTTEHHADGRVSFYFERSVTKVADTIKAFGVGVQIPEDDYCHVAMQYLQSQEVLSAHRKIEEVLSS
jgi:hypothetical protein